MEFTSGTSAYPMLEPLPTLQLEGSDVVIKLGHEPERWLFIHSSMIRKAIPVLAPLLKPEWRKPDTVIDPQTGEEVEVHTFALSFCNDQTFLLDGKVCSPLVANKEIQPSPAFQDIYSPEYKFPSGHAFIASPLASEGWEGFSSDMSPARDLAPDAALAIACMFLLLYGHHIPIKALDPHGTETHWGEPRYDSVITYHVALIASYAEYYGCLERIAQPLFDIMTSHSNFWQAVSQAPTQYMALASKLRIKKLYFDALRHLIARYTPDADTGIPEALGLSNEELEAKYEPHITKLKQEIAPNLERSLLKLHLSIIETRCNGQHDVIHTTFFNKLRHANPNRSSHAKAMERFHFLAASTYTQFVIQQLYGSVAYLNTNNKIRERPAGSLNRLCFKLTAAHESEDPSRIFGYEAASRLSSIFRLGRPGYADKHVKRMLEILVKRAAEVIQWIFRTREADPELGEPDGWTYRRCEFDVVGDHFTYLPLDEREVPWGSEVEWREGSSPDMSTVPASEDWVAAVAQKLGWNGAHD